MRRKVESVCDYDRMHVGVAAEKMMRFWRENWKFKTSNNKTKQHSRRTSNYLLFFIIICLRINSNTYLPYSIKTMPPHDGINTCIVPDENNDDMENTEKQHRRKKHKKLLMGEESGLSDEQRRELRRNQRELNKQLQNGPVNEDGEDDEDEEMSRAFVLKVRKENNKLFEKVRTLMIDS